jgi:hypothetical protein
MDVDMISEEAVLFGKALADETRQKIMKLVCCYWLSVNEIVAQPNQRSRTISPSCGKRAWCAFGRPGGRPSTRSIESGSPSAAVGS